MKKLLVICGPTASGKSALAVECAKLLDGEVISCDAFQIYRGLDIGTAKPTKDEMQGIPHHMIDIVGADEPFSASDFKEQAISCIEDILARGKTPVLCGGTGFYLKAALYQSSLGNTPADEALRKKYELLERTEGRTALHARLFRVDPESAEKLHENDVKRVIRALEIHELTGKKKSDQHDGEIPRYPYAAFSFLYPRETLYERIERRVDDMFRAGLENEVKSLLESGISPEAQSMQGIGYKEVVEGLKNGDLQSTMSDIVKKNTRNYAKRQETFFKKLENLHYLTPASAKEAAQEVIRLYAGE